VPLGAVHGGATGQWGQDGDADRHRSDGYERALIGARAQRHDEEGGAGDER
jgi:hypothetical protein